MSIFDKTKSATNICGLEIAFRGKLLPSDIPEWQPFYNSSEHEIDFTKTYFGFGSVSFAEESSMTNAGTIYRQKISIRFPVSDEKRAERLALLGQAKFFKLQLNNGKDIVIGRNDFNQNARPKITIKTNVRIAEAEFETVSMFPSGYSPNNGFFLPALLPLTLI